MSARKGKARPKRAAKQAVLRHLQMVLAVATCIRIAADYDEGEQIDLADSIAGLLVLLEEATAMLDPPGGAL